MSEVEPKAQELSLAWASYVLGHNARTFRMWQFVHWLSLGPGGRVMPSYDSSLTWILKQTDEATLALQDKLSSDIREQIQECFQANVEISQEEFEVPAGRSTDWMYWGYDESSYGYEQWSKLIKLVAESLSEVKDLRGWWQLGDALGEFQHDLNFQNPNARLGQSLWIYPTLQCAAALYDQGHTSIAEIEELMRSYRYRFWLPTEQLLASAVETEEKVVRGTSTSSQAVDLVTKQATKLDSRLRDVLTHYDPSDIQALPELDNTKERDVTPLTDLELAILNALESRKLTTKELANEVCDGRQRDLFSKGKSEGPVNRLKRLGLIKNVHGTGYYSTKFPPPEWEKYS